MSRSAPYAAAHENAILNSSPTRRRDQIRTNLRKSSNSRLSTDVISRATRASIRRVLRLHETGVPRNVGVLLRHAVQLPGELPEEHLELFERVVPQTVHDRPVRQDNVRLELVFGRASDSATSDKAK